MKDETKLALLFGVPIVISLFIWSFLFLHRPALNKPTVPFAHVDVQTLSFETLERVKGFTVLISNESMGGVGRGTGVLIDPLHVLTCAHMLSDETDQMMVFTYPLGAVQLATPVWADRHHDLAVLELGEPVNLEHYAVFNSTPVIGHPLMVVGNILGSMRWFVSYGLVSDIRGFYLITDATVRGGNSGGPWVDMQGNVLAITDWGLENRKGEPEEISGGVGAKTIQTFLEHWKHPSLMDLLIQ